LFCAAAPTPRYSVYSPSATCSRSSKCIKPSLDNTDGAPRPLHSTALSSLPSASSLPRGNRRSPTQPPLCVP
jgi:hypothetical protein